LPSSNKRRAKAPLALRDLGADPSAGYASVAIGGEVDILEITGRPASMPSPAGGAPWAYVYLGRGDGLYGWVPLADLEDQPVASGTITVRPVSNKRTPGLMLTPELVAADDAAAAEEKRLADAAKAATEAAKAAGHPGAAAGRADRRRGQHRRRAQPARDRRRARAGSVHVRLRAVGSHAVLHLAHAQPRAAPHAARGGLARAAPVVVPGHDGHLGRDGARRLARARLRQAEALGHVLGSDPLEARPGHRRSR
jgi:hypothetical protein